MAEENHDDGRGAPVGQTHRFTAKVPTPTKLKIAEEGLEQRWKSFKRGWKIYEKASRLEDQDTSYRTSVLLACIGDEAMTLYDTFQFAEGESEEDIDTVIAKFEQYCVGTTNEAFESYRFHMRHQEKNESIEAYVAELRKLAKNCNFDQFEDRMIRDRIVVGVHDPELRKKLLEKKTLDLSSAIDIGKSHETAESQLKQMSGKVEAIAPQRASSTANPSRRGGRDGYRGAHGGRGRGHARHSPGAAARAGDGKGMCGRCGKPKHASLKECPAAKARCHSCGNQGHYFFLCKSNKKANQGEVQAEREQEAFLGAVNSQSGEPWRVNVLVDDQNIEFKMDTGADVTCVNPERLSKQTLVAPDKKLYGPGRTQLKVAGMFTAQLKAGNECQEENIYVVQNLEEPLLSRRAVEGLRLIQRIGSVDTTKIKSKYPGLWRGLGDTGQEYTIKMKENAKPFALSAPRRVPLPYQNKVKEELERLQNLGVIRPVTSPTEWCAPIVVVPKANSEAVRLCVDLTKLNESVMRENYPLPSTDQLLAQLKGAKFFSKLDCNNGFYQIRLAEQSQELTTFITPFGRYCFQRLPFGISSGSEVFHRMMSQLLAGIPGVICDIDDVMVFAESEKQHDERLHTVLDKLEKAGVTLNEKCRFKETEVTFLGHIISAEGVKIDPKKIEAIKNMPRPQNITELRRFLGLINFVRKFAPSLAEKSKPLRELLKKEIQWTWEETQENAFQDMKATITSPPVLAHYATDAPTKVSADASSYGLGAVLLQEDKEKQWRPVFYASRSMTATEQRYAQVEKEALAATWACEKFADFLIGIPSFVLETDHRPLLALLKTKQLDELSPRIQRFRMRLMRYHYDIVYTAGKHLTTADALSRAPSGKPDDSDRKLENDTTNFVHCIMQSVPATDKKLREIRDRQEEDDECQTVKKYCMTGWPQKSPPGLKQYFILKSDLSVQEGILMYRHRIVIPSVMREETLQKLHAGHQGVAKTRALARASVWWPGLSTRINTLVADCPTCAKERPAPVEPMIPTPVPEFPWQRVGIDLMEFRGENYLVLIDYFSKYIELAMLKTLTSQETTNHIKSIFARHGVPQTVMSDNGTQFSSSTFADFAEKWSFTHDTSSPLYPQSNGEAERAVKTLKDLLIKAQDPYLALLIYRATPLQCGYSPAEKLFGRKIRTPVPTTNSNLQPSWPYLQEMRQKDMHLKAAQKENYDKRHRVRGQPELKKGDNIWLKSSEKTTPAVIENKVNTRSYLIKTENQGMKRRNRKHLNRRIPSDTQTNTEKTPKIQNTIIPTEIAPEKETNQIDIEIESSQDNNVASERTPTGTQESTTTRSGRVSRAPDRLNL